MSIAIKSARELELMRVASRIVANTLVDLRAAVAPGMTTKELDRIAERSIKSQGGDPAFPYVNDFPGCVCISVNNEVVHGIPGKRRLESGDLVKLDVGAIYDGYHGDAAITVPVGIVSSEAQRLLDVTEALPGGGNRGSAGRQSSERHRRCHSGLCGASRVFHGPAVRRPRHRPGATRGADRAALSAVVPRHRVAAGNGPDDRAHGEPGKL